MTRGFVLEMSPLERRELSPTAWESPPPCWPLSPRVQRGPRADALARGGRVSTLPETGGRGEAGADGTGLSSGRRSRQVPGVEADAGSAVCPRSPRWSTASRAQSPSADPPTPDAHAPRAHRARATEAPRQGGQDLWHQTDTLSSGRGPALTAVRPSAGHIHTVIPRSQIWEAVRPPDKRREGRPHSGGSSALERKQLLLQHHSFHVHES